MADVTKAIEPKSDQANAEDFLPPGPTGARTFTIAKVDVRDSTEQPISVWLAEFPRPWKPAKTMSKLMRLAWTNESDNWVGNRVTLYTDPDVKFGPAVMGGIRISHMSGIGRKPLAANLATTRGKRVMWTVQPLDDDAPAPARAPSPLDQLVWAFNAKRITEKTARLDFCRNIVDRPINSAADLTPDEVSTVIAALNEGPTGEPVDPLEPTDAEIEAARAREAGQ